MKSGFIDTFRFLIKSPIITVGGVTVPMPVKITKGGG